ncbi:putative alternative large T antigen [Miniopterus schreibersii polyomavirus 2]|uniref:Putative alternative large T antigen n=1 Tax=Miniopterus schreibersii polyomavirus 2 TaxID=1904409 RepID=A0A1S7J010_9POLY|nr:putative alternative large T antigen [Miniopterus schreibersii polyomavirus 2]BAX01882.1 putative alternative large T antigen [Miniopterus schreibersii polyomavirus 2]
MDPVRSESDTLRGPPEYLPMKGLDPSQIYIAMNPVTPPHQKRPPPQAKPPPQDTIPTPLILDVDSLPPPLPPKTRSPPRRSVSLPSRRPPPNPLMVEVENLERSLRQKEQDLVTMWMDLVRARKQASRARHQRKKQKWVMGLLIFLLVFLIILAMLYLLIKHLIAS